ncbi:MAG: hypothetical protein HY815_17845 [Candidatus Riflebacteria bacterium]|nr:hypothetical protein [Candidatus Riflebacteria bacterium]
MIRLTLLIAGIAVAGVATRLPPDWLEAAPTLWKALVTAFSFSTVGLLALLVALVDPRSHDDRPPGTTFGAVEDEGAPFRCPVCGMHAAGARLVCTVCETPHHVDCALWAGGCATYGCQRPHSGTAPLFGTD